MRSRILEAQQFLESQGEFKPSKEQIELEKNEGSVEYWSHCGFPLILAEYLKEHAIEYGPDGVMERANRFRDYWRKDTDSAQEIAGLWKTLEASIGPGYSLRNIFMSWPDKPDRSPLSPFSGIRKHNEFDRQLTVEEEKAGYSRAEKNVAAVLELLSNCDQYRLLHTDAIITGGDARKHINEVDVTATIKSLQHLEQALRSVDPAAKFPTGKPDAKSAPMQNYVIVLSKLNSYLKEPRHAAIADLANINNPTNLVKPDRIRKAWDRRRNKDWP